LIVPVNEPLFTNREVEYVTKCVQSGWVSSSGNYVKEFEERWADFCNRKYGVSVTSGTSALQIAISSLNLKPGDEIILPTLTIISCVLYAGCTPVLVDSEPNTWTMDVNHIEDKITSRTKAIMIVHLYGHPVNVDPILELSERYGLEIIEDAAQAHGAEYLSNYKLRQPQWIRCGSVGTLSCFSFYANKPITTGEGGMVLTDDSKLGERLRYLRNLCFQDSKRYYHEELGFNFRFTNLQAALGLAQVERIDQITKKKRWIGAEYISRLSRISEISLQVEEKWAKSIYWMFGITVKEENGMTGEHLSRLLFKLGIDTRPFFIGMHQQPALKKKGLFKDERYPVAEKLSRQGLYLPSGLALTEEQIDKVCTTLEKVFQ